MALHIDVWSDIACPWCYVGKRKLEAALAASGRTAEVEIAWHPFELDPSAPREVDLGDGSYAERLARKYGVSVAQGQAMIDRMTGNAAEVGIAMRFDRVRPGNTFDAHRLLAFAGGRGVQDALSERLFAAYLCEGALVGDPDTLTALAVEVGLPEDEVRGVLASDAHAEEVRAEEAEAAAMGCTGVPFFVFGRRYAVPGAQPVEVLTKVLERSFAELTPEIVAGALCGPEGC